MICAHCLCEKARYAKLEGLAGISLSSVGMDDFDGQCGQGSYPLLNAVANVFRSTEIESRNVENPFEDKKVFCSISSFAERMLTDMSFDLTHLNPFLCTHLLIEQNSSFASPIQFRKLTNSNKNLRIVLSIDFDEKVDLNRFKDDVHVEQIDGINLRLNSNTFNRNHLDLIQVD